MASSNTTLKFTALAEAAITKNTFQKIGSADKYATPATAGAAIIGIAEDSAAINTPVGISIAGEAKLKIGDTVTRGGYLKSDASGYGVPVSSNNDEIGAYALESGVVGDIISVVICKGVYGV